MSITPRRFIRLASWLILAGGMAAACVIRPPSSGPTARDLLVRTCTPGASVWFERVNPAVTLQPITTDAQGDAEFRAAPTFSGDGINIHITADGYAPYDVEGAIVPAGNHQLLIGSCWPLTSVPLQLQFAGLVPLVPPAPTRAALVGVNTHFQGLTVTCDGYGTIPVFEVMVTSVDATCRANLYAVKHAVGDTHEIMAVSWNYQNDGPYSYPVQGNDLSSDLQRLRAIVVEGIQQHFTPTIFLGGDGQTPAAGGYSDPVGWTFGYAGMMQRLPGIIATLQNPTDLTDRVCVSPGFDGIISYNEQTQTFEPWSLEQLNTYLVTVRRLAPHICSLVETAAGPLGGTLTNFLSADARDALDGILHEFPGLDQWPSDQVFQIADRALGPAFVRPADMPASDDPDAPFPARAGKWSLFAPTSRGPIVAIAFEWDLYRWVRGLVDLVGIERGRAILRAMGYSYVG